MLVVKTKRELNPRVTVTAALCVCVCVSLVCVCVCVNENVKNEQHKKKTSKKKRAPTLKNKQKKVGVIFVFVIEFIVIEKELLAFNQFLIQKYSDRQRMVVYCRPYFVKIKKKKKSFHNNDGWWRTLFDEKTHARLLQRSNKMYYSYLKLKN